MTSILLETVGVGQSEIEIAAVADPTIVILNPGAGDAIQAAKAGLLEVADLVVVNKADRDGADQTVRDLRAETHAPILKLVAAQGDGVDELVEAIDAAPTRRHSGTPRRAGPCADPVAGAESAAAPPGPRSAGRRRGRRGQRRLRGRRPAVGTEIGAVSRCRGQESWSHGEARFCLAPAKAPSLGRTQVGAAEPIVPEVGRSRLCKPAFYFARMQFYR